MLPSADYARSKIPKVPVKEIDDLVERERMKIIEEHARKKICETYVEGNDRFTVFVEVPESVKQEMCALGWVVNRHVHMHRSSGAMSYECVFSLPN